MTDERMAPLELVERDADGGLVREVPAFAAERPMERKVEAAAGAAKSLPRACPGPDRGLTRGRALAAEDGPEGRPARAALGDARGPDRARDPAAREGQLPAELPRAAQDRAEGLGGRHSRQAPVHGVSTRAVDDRRRAPWAGRASRRAGACPGPDPG